MDFSEAMGSVLTASDKADKVLTGRVAMQGHFEDIEDLDERDLARIVHAALEGMPGAKYVSLGKPVLTYGFEGGALDEVTIIPTVGYRKSQGE